MSTCCRLTCAPLISAEQDAVIVAGVSATPTPARPLYRSSTGCDQRLNRRAGASMPTYRIAVTGLSVVSARNRALMIDSDEQPHDRDRLRRHIHRPCLPLTARHVDQRLPGHFAHRPGRSHAAARARACSSPASSRYGLIRTRAEHHHSFSQSAADRGYRSRSRRRASSGRRFWSGRR